MIKIEIKPLSVNEAWKGRRFKTDAYKHYQLALMYLLPPNLKIPKGKLTIHLQFGLSSTNADWDNPIKQFQDIICKKYGINDKQIYKGIVEKVDVKKGEEFVKFKIESYVESI